MGWLTKLGSLIINGNGSGEKILDAGMSGIDKVFHTDEEKAERQKELYDKWQELQLKFAERGTATAINRRFVSWFVIGNVTATFWLCAGLALLGNIDQAEAVLELADKFWIGEAFVAVIGFYYGPHVLGALGRK